MTTPEEQSRPQDHMDEAIRGFGPYLAEHTPSQIEPPLLSRRARKAVLNNLVKQGVEPKSEVLRTANRLMKHGSKGFHVFGTLETHLSVGQAPEERST